MGKSENQVELDETERALLSAMAKSSLARIDPVPRSSSPTGFIYPFLTDALKLGEGSEAVVLDPLVEKGIFVRKLFDEIQACPHCHSTNISVGNACSDCRDCFVQKDEVLHHYRCAFMGAGRKFAADLELVCPKCHRKLDSVGVDYDVSLSYYQCTGCSAKIGEEWVRGKCRKCQREFSASETLGVRVYSYLLTPLGQRLAIDGKTPRP